MPLTRDKASSGRELLHRAAMLLASDLPMRDLVEKFALMIVSATGAASAFVSLRQDGRTYLEFGTPSGDGIAVSVFGGEGQIGELRAVWPQGVEPDDYDATVLEACAVRLGARVQHEFEREERERLKEIASTDALTGLANRRTFDETLLREWTRCARSQSPLSILLLDVDFFKSFNDTYGHVAGDACLQRVASAIASRVKRPGDIACRYGGEEFAVILPETLAADAIRVAESICEAVRGEQLSHQGSSLGYATVSVGCAGTVPQAGADPSSLTQAADAELYRAKEHGRNRVASEAAISDAPVVERQTGPQTNLPSPQNLFFGRDGDLDVMSALSQHCRVITVAGPAGVGKTRLSIEFARRHAGEYRDGVYFVNLAPLSDASFVAPALLATLNVHEQPGRDPAETLVHHLDGKQMLLVLDNCEHVADRLAILLERLLAETAGPSFLVTSRRGLRIEGEHVYRLATLQHGEAVALFSSRARAVMPSFSINAQNIATVKTICTQLNGTPLAIELAAARVRLMTVEQLETELREREQSSTVDDTIEWSYSVLDSEEKLLMRRLSIFASAFTLDVARMVCVNDDEQLDIIDVIGRLIDKSLVQSDPVEGRYWLLEATRAFGRRLLEQNAEIDGLRSRYLDVLQNIARSAEKGFGQGAGDQRRSDIISNYSDFRAAMEWALAEGGSVQAGASLVASLAWYWTERGLWREGRYWLDLALGYDIGEMGAPLAARLLLGSAVAYYVQGNFPEMAREAKRCYDAYNSVGDRTGTASAENLMAIAAQFAGDLQEASDLWNSVLRASKEVANIRMEAVVLGNLAELLTDWKSDFAQSEELYERAAEIHRQLSNSFPLGVTLGDWSATAAYQGDMRRAERLALDALEIFRDIDEEMRVIEMLIRIGHYRVWAGRHDEAQRSLRDALELLPGCANPLYLVRAAEALAELALELNRPGDAAALLAFAGERRREKNLSRPAPVTARLDAAHALCMEKLQDDEAARAAERGRTMSDDGAIDLGRSLFTK